MRTSSCSSGKRTGRIARRASCGSSWRSIATVPPATSTCTSSPRSRASAISARRARGPSLRLSRLDRDGHARPHLRVKAHLNRMQTERAERLVQHDFGLVDLRRELPAECFRDLLRGDAAEGLALLAGFELEDQRDARKPFRQRLGVGLRASALCLLGFALLREVFELAAGGLDREALRQQVVQRVPVGHVLDVAGAAEAADLALQDDAHACRGGGQEEAEDASSSAVSCSLRRHSISHASTDAATATTPITVSAPMIASRASTTPKKPGPESWSLMRSPFHDRECAAAPE